MRAHYQNPERATRLYLRLYNVSTKITACNKPEPSSGYIFPTSRRSSRYPAGSVAFLLVPLSADHHGRPKLHQPSHSGQSLPVRNHGSLLGLADPGYLRARKKFAGHTPTTAIRCTQSILFFSSLLLWRWSVESLRRSLWP